MTFPGPGLLEWGIALVALAGAIAALGELVRWAAARYVPFLRSLDPLERALLDLYVGGAVFYALGALGGFYPTAVLGLLAGGAAAGAVGWAIVRRVRQAPPPPGGPLRELGTVPYWIALASAVGLLVIELAAIGEVGSGNTYDSSLLATYTGLLLSHHALPWSLAPVAAGPLAYPQGTTAWLGVAQSAFGLPPLRTSLLVTPLFLALVPLGAFAVGRRLTASPWTGAACAVTFAGLGAATTSAVAGSNDFVLALPLVLLLFAWSGEWAAGPGPSVGFSVTYGLLAGAAASLNPVGPVWLFLSLLALRVAGTGGPPASGALRWGGRWVVAIAVALPFVAPSFAALAATSGSPAGPGASGESSAAFVSSVDPFLFRAGDEMLSWSPILRLELAVLLVLGVGLFLWSRFRLPGLATLGRALLAGGGVAFVLLLGGVLANARVPGISLAYSVLSAGEIGRILFALYVFVAAVPLATGLGSWVARAPASAPPAGRRRPAPRGSWAPPLAALLVAAIVVPGITVTVASGPAEFHATYLEFSNLTSADVDFLEWAPGHLHPGDTVLVAPGSVAEFLPGYAPWVELQYPMSEGFLTAHPTYWTVVHELQNGSLDAAGWSGLRALGTEYVAVTENNTALFRPFLPTALAGMPTAVHEGGVYLFWVSPAVPLG